MKLTPLPSPPFRPGATVGDTRFSLIFNAGGIGDYINWTPAVRSAIDRHPWIFGHVVTPPYFSDLAHLWFDGYSDRFTVWDTFDYNDDTALKELGGGWIVPGGNQYANACGFSLMHLGFVYYLQQSAVPKGTTLPLIKGNEADVSRFALPASYVVLTPYATAENRRLSAEAYNAVIDYCHTKGVMPVFLGKADLAPDHKMLESAGIRYDMGLDLREKTSLREAAVIMHWAKAVIGLDNGLLHLAACTKTTVINCFTTVDPALRIAPRPYPAAKTIVLTPGESLHCRFCNTTMRYLIGHDFKNCLSGDNACVKMITGDSLVSALREVL